MGMGIFCINAVHVICPGSACSVQFKTVKVIDCLCVCQVSVRIQRDTSASHGHSRAGKTTVRRNRMSLQN